ncbi:MAG: porphobilinogen synthase [Treponemataceae bacterium]
MIERFRRLRKTQTIRNLVSDVHFSINQLVMPYFVVEGSHIKEPIQSMKNQYRFSIDMLITEVSSLVEVGISSILLFGIPSYKDFEGSGAWDENGIIPRAIRSLKKHFPQLCIIADVCLCEYTSTGHCGIYQNGSVDNELSLPLLAKTALAYANAGADIIAPSNMMDNNIHVIRQALDSNGFYDTPIMAYSIKYASSYYGPFRDAANSAPQQGDRKGYQMDFRRKNEPLLKAQSDIEQGADIVIVKPALAYLDILQKIAHHVHTPLAIYNVSGEYAMVKAAAEHNYIDERSLVMENMYAFCRAGAHIIISYHAKDIALWRDYE